jgi:hypothetical protein
MTVYRTFPGGWQSVLDSVKDSSSQASGDPFEPGAG